MHDARAPTAKQVIEEGGGAALGEEVTGELEDPGRDVKDRGELHRVWFVGECSGGEADEEPFRCVQELRLN